MSETAWHLRLGRNIAAFPGLVLATVVFVFYAWWCGPGNAWMDSGELTASAFGLGSAHPPGHPLFVHLAKLATFFPLGEIAFRVTLLSAACMSVATWLAFRLGVVLVRRSWLMALLGLALAVSPAFVQNATRPEVYALVWALLSAALWLIFPPLVQRREVPLTAGLGAALLCGLAAAVHPVIAAGFAFGLGLMLLWSWRKKILVRLPGLIVAGILPMVLYVSFWVRSRSAMPPWFAWDLPHDTAQLWNLMSAKAYQGNFSFAGLGQRAAGLWSYLGQGSAAPLMLLGMGGLILGTITKLRGTVWILLLSLLVLFGAALQENFNPDMRGYLWFWLVGCGIGVAVLVAAGIRLLSLHKTGLVLIGELALLAPLGFLAWYAPPAPDFDRDDSPNTLWTNVMAEVPPGPGLFVAQSDHVLFAGVYERWVAGVRPDIALGHDDLVRDEWFVRALKRAQPALYVPYVDDGKPGQMARRLVEGNFKKGFPVYLESPNVQSIQLPSDLRLVAQNASYRVVGPGQQTLDSRAQAPFSFRGEIGGKVAGAMAVWRARFALGKQDWPAVWLALAIEPDELEQVANPEPRRPALLSFLPPFSGFVYEPWHRTVVIRELAWSLGVALPLILSPKDNPPNALAIALHELWMKWLENNTEPSVQQIEALGQGAIAATSLMILNQKGLENNADSWLKSVCNARPSDVPTRMLAAAFYANQGRPAEAEARLLQAAAVEPQNVEIWARLGVMQARQRNSEGARASWQKALALDPSRGDIAQWLKQL